MELYQEYWMPTLLVILAIVLELVVNREFHGKDLIPCMISTPKEIILLSMGFIASYTATSSSDHVATTGVVLFIISFIISLIIYGLRVCSLKIHSNLANNSKNRVFKHYLPLIGCMVLSWIVSVGFYAVTVITCLGGELL